LIWTEEVVDIAKVSQLATVLREATEIDAPPATRDS